MKILNCTPHDVVLLDGLTEITFKKSGYVARIPFTKKVVGEIFGAPLIEHVKGDMVFQDSLGVKINEPSDLRDYDFMLVSTFVLEEVRGTKWEGFCISPNAKTAKRDVDNSVLGIYEFNI